jgi:hypothetical protein
MKYYHVPINSIYIELVKRRYTGPKYSKWDIKYYSKASNTLLAYERSVKIYHGTQKNWEEWKVN